MARGPPRLIESPGVRGGVRFFYFFYVSSFCNCWLSNLFFSFSEVVLQRQAMISSGLSARQQPGHSRRLLSLYILPSLTYLFYHRLADCSLVRLEYPFSKKSFQPGLQSRKKLFCPNPQEFQGLGLDCSSIPASSS